MTPKRVFLTGASGNVGAAVLDELLARGIETTALVRSNVPARGGFRPIFSDMTRLGDIAFEIALADGVIHCASPRTNDRQRALGEDIGGTSGLITAWQAGPFVYASSQTVYGTPTACLHEDMPVKASNWYDLAKICNEQQIQMSAHFQGCGPGVSIRLPLVFSSGVRRRDRQFLPRLFDALAAGRTFLFESEEAMETHGSVFIGEADIGRAMVDALRLTESGAYNVAGGFCTWKALLLALSEKSGYRVRFRIDPDFSPGQDDFRMPRSRSEYDCTKFTKATGFQPSEPLTDVVERFVSAEMSQREN